MRRSRRPLSRPQRPRVRSPAPLPVGGTKKADLLDYSSSTRPVIVGALAGDDTVIGSRYDDVPSGGAGDDRITVTG